MMYLGNQAVGIATKYESSPWKRPYNWPNLNAIDYTNFEGGYFTYDLTVSDYAKKWVGIYINPNQSTTNCVIERGHLENNVFVADEQYTFTGNSFRTYLDPQNGNVQLFRVSGSGFIQMGLIGDTSDNNTTCRSWDCPCVEIALRLPNAYGAVSSDQNYTLNYLAFVSIFTQHITLIDFGKDTTNTLDMYRAFRMLGPVKIDVVGTKPKISSINRMFDTYTGDIIDLRDFDLSQCKNLGQCFYGSSATKIYMNNTGLTNPTNLDSMSNSSATYFDLSGCDFSETKATYTTLYLPTNIVDFYPPTLGDHDYNFGVYKNLSVASIMRIIDKLPVTTNNSVLTLGMNYLKLASEQIAIATAKGWTVNRT